MTLSSGSDSGSVALSYRSEGERETSGAVGERLQAPLAGCWRSSEKVSRCLLPAAASHIICSATEWLLSSAAASPGLSIRLRDGPSQEENSLHGQLGERSAAPPPVLQPHPPDDNLSLVWTLENKKQTKKKYFGSICSPPHHPPSQNRLVVILLEFTSYFMES